METHPRSIGLHVKASRSPKLERDYAAGIRRGGVPGTAKKEKGYRSASICIWHATYQGQPVFAAQTEQITG
jgi:hypothetical protein